MLAGLCNLPIRDVALLTLREVPYLKVARPAWLALFKAMPNIVSLSIASDPPCTSDIISLLQTHIEAADSQKEKPIMPKLRRLLLQEIRFQEYHTDEDGTFVAGLCAAIKARRKGGRKLEKLHIKKCINMDEDDVLQLELEEVVEVVWDGEVEYEDEEDEEEDDYLDDDDAYGFYGRPLGPRDLFY
ncbi:hypothetical protein EUX98_g8899 [Antrodiella citrinella]|uniref:Uncharacterized protein n=1 Tax=Antrodiella citrinella TaxID=2447956 RepID=A0A4V3XFT5_9APHY|nr:hypothetical protein EUX98_g8899 [Antrodiella citrinella]